MSDQTPEQIPDVIPEPPVDRTETFTNWGNMTPPEPNPYLNSAQSANNSGYAPVPQSSATYPVESTVYGPPPTPPAYNPYQAYPTGYNPNKTNTLAIITLIVAFIWPFAAIITGFISLNQIKKTGEQGRGLALGGLVVGAVFTFIGVIFYIGFFVVAATHPGTAGY